uniref:Uncharacterized protein n=1 Tax=viral metagenome TaxID=1070528 RepID=A0A6M3MAN6_9ZZZZ
MVRSFILSNEQRQAIKNYLGTRPTAMSSQIRQIRLRAKKLNYDAFITDMELLKQLAVLKVPKGRKTNDVKASFTVKQR